MSHYHYNKGYRGDSFNRRRSKYSAYSPGRRLFASNLEELQLLSMQYNCAKAEQKTRFNTNLSNREIKDDDNSGTVNRSSLFDMNSNSLEFSSKPKLETISAITTSTCQKVPGIDLREEKKITKVKPFQKSNEGKQHVQKGIQSQELVDRLLSDNIRAYLSGVADNSSEHHSPTCFELKETKKVVSEQDLTKSVSKTQDSSSSTGSRVLWTNLSLGNIVSQSLTGAAASDSATSSCFVTQSQRQSNLSRDVAYRDRYVGLPSQFHSAVKKLDGRGVMLEPLTKSVTPGSRSTNSFQISGPSQIISSRVKKDPPRNNEPVSLISSAGKKPTNQGAVWRKLTGNIVPRSEPSGSRFASVQSHLEPVNFTIGRETCENKVLSADLNISSFITNKVETSPTEPNKCFYPDDMFSIQKSMVKPGGQVQQEGVQSEKSRDSLVNSRIVRPVKISSRDPRKYGRLFANDSFQCFSGLGSVLQQSNFSVGSQSQNIQGCSGQIEISKERKDHLTKAGQFSVFSDSNSLGVKGVRAVVSKKGSSKLVQGIYGQTSEEILPKRNDGIILRLASQQSTREKSSIGAKHVKAAISLTRDCSYLHTPSKVERKGTMEDSTRQQNQERTEIQSLRPIGCVTQSNIRDLHTMDRPLQSHLLPISMNNSTSAKVDGDCASVYARSSLEKEYNYMEKDQVLSILQQNSYPGIKDAEEMDIARLPKEGQTEAEKTSNKDQVINIQKRHSYPGLKDVEHSYPGLKDVEHSYPGLKDVEHSYPGLKDVEHSYSGLKDVEHSYPGLKDVEHSYPGLKDVEQRYLSRLQGEGQKRADKTSMKDRVFSILKDPGMKYLEDRHIGKLPKEGQIKAKKTGKTNQIISFLNKHSFSGQKDAEERRIARLPKEGHRETEKTTDCILDTRKPATHPEAANDLTQSIPEKRQNKGSGKFNKTVYTPREMKIFVRHLQAGFAGVKPISNSREGGDQAMKHVDKSADRDPSAVRIVDKLSGKNYHEWNEHAVDSIQALLFSVKPIKDKNQALPPKDKLNEVDTPTMLRCDKSKEREVEALSSVESPMEKGGPIVLPCHQSAEYKAQYVPPIDNFPEINIVSFHHIPTLNDVFVTSTTCNSTKEYIPSNVIYNTRNTRVLSPTDRTIVGNTVEVASVENSIKSNAQSVPSIDNPIRRNAPAVLPSNSFHVTDVLSIINHSERCMEMVPPTNISTRSDWQPVAAVSQLPVYRTPTCSLIEDEAKIIEREILQNPEDLLNVDRYSVADVFITNENPENFKGLIEVLQSKNLNSSLMSGCQEGGNFGIPPKNTLMNDHRSFNSEKMDQAIFIVKEHNYPAVNDMVQRHRTRLLQKGTTDSARISHVICTRGPRDHAKFSDFCDEKQSIDQKKQNDKSQKLENKLPSTIDIPHIQSETKETTVRDGPAVATIDKSLESNVLATPFIKSVKEENIHVLPSACMLIDTNSKAAPLTSNLNRDTPGVTAVYNSCHRNASAVPTTTEQNVQHVDSSVNDDVRTVISADKSTNIGCKAMTPMTNPSDKNGKVVPSIKISREKDVPLCDNSNEQNAQPLPSVDNSNVRDAHALPSTDKSTDNIEKAASLPENFETSRGHERMGTEDQVLHSLNKDKEYSPSKSLQARCMNAVLNVQPVQPCTSDLSSSDMQNSSKPHYKQTVVDYGDLGDIYDLDVPDNLQPNSLEQNSSATEKSVPLFPAHSFSAGLDDSFGLDEIMYHPTAVLIGEWDPVDIFQRETTPSKKNQKYISDKMSPSSAKVITEIKEEKSQNLSMTQLCRDSTLHDSERNIKILSQAPKFAGVVEKDGTLEAEKFSNEKLLEKENDVSNNCTTGVNKDKKYSERKRESDTDFIRDILSNMDKTHEKGTYSLIQKTQIETVTEDGLTTQAYGNCSNSHGKMPSTMTRNLSAEKGRNKNKSCTRHNVRITDVLLLEAKEFLRKDTVTGNRSGLNRIKLETPKKRSSRLLLKQLKTTPRKAEKSVVRKLKTLCRDKRKGTRRKSKEKQQNKENGSDLIKETCEKAVIVTNENKGNRESSIIADCSVQTFPCKDIESQTEQLLLQKKIPGKMYKYQKTDIKKRAGDKRKYGVQRSNKLAKLARDACNAENGERSNGSQSPDTFKHSTKTDKTDANNNVTKEACHETQTETFPNVEGRNEALSLVAKLKERIEKPNQVCPFDDDINLRDYVSEVRTSKMDTNQVSVKLISKSRKKKHSDVQESTESKKHLDVQESTESKRSRCYFKADGPEQLRYGKERKKYVRKNLGRKLKGHHHDEDAEMTVTFLKTASGETKIKPKVSEHNEKKTRDTPLKQTMKIIKTKLVFSREEFEKSKKERRQKQCVYCGAMNKEVLHTIHLKKFHPHRCAQCRKDFQSKKFKWEHHLQTHVQQTYPCGPCDRKFISKPFFARHLVSAAHRHRISDIVFQQFVKKSSHSADTVGLVTEAKTSSEMDVLSDHGSLCDGASIAEFVRQHQEQSLFLNLIQDQTMLGSRMDVTTPVMEQNNVQKQQASNLLNSNYAGVRVFGDTNVAEGWMDVCQHHSTTRLSQDLSISSHHVTTNSHPAFIPTNESSTYAQIGAVHDSAELTSAIYMSNYKSCLGNVSGEHSSTGQELTHCQNENLQPGQGPINTSSEIENYQSPVMVSSGWLSTAINVIADDCISHDTEYIVWPDQSLPKVSTNTYSNLEGGAVIPHQSGSDCLNFHQLEKDRLDSIQTTHQSEKDHLDSIQETHQLEKDHLDSIQATHQLEKNHLVSIQAAQQSKDGILDCKQSCISRTICESTESMNTFANHACSTGSKARPSHPESFDNTHSDSGLVQCSYTSCNQQVMEQDAAALNLNAVNNESVSRSCEPTIFCVNRNSLTHSNQSHSNNNSVVPDNKPDKSTMSSSGCCSPNTLMWSNQCMTCSTPTAPIYVNSLSNGYHHLSTSLISSLSENPQSTQNPSPNYRVPSEENNGNIESEERLREQLNQIMFDIELSEKQAQQY